MNRVAHHPEASDEIAEGIDYYLEHAPPGIAINFNNAIEVGVAKIAESPLRFSCWKKTRARKYVVPDFPYVIFYLEHSEFIRILAVAHTSRRPGYWRKRIGRR